MLLLSGTYAEAAPEAAGMHRAPGPGGLTAPGMHAADGPERRRGLRIRQRRPVKVFEPAARRYHGGRTEDISAAGLRIELPAWATVRPGEEIAVHVGLNRKGESLAHRRQMMAARVVWVKRTGGRHPRLEAGVEFLASIAAHLDAA